MKNDTWLKSITLNNYRCFKHLKVDLNRQLTVLVADNGAGKTTILDAISITLSAFVGAFYNGKRNPINKNDVHLKVFDSTLLQMEPQYPCILDCDGTINDQAVSWQRRMNTPNSQNTFKEAKAVIDIGDALQTNVTNEHSKIETVLPVIAYYGTGRLWSQKKYAEKTTFGAEFYSRTAGYLDCLDPSSSYKTFVDWFRYAAKAHRDQRDQNEQRYGEQGLTMPTPYAALLKGITQVVDSCLKHSGWHGLRYSSIHNAPVVEHSQHGILEVSQLSDGLRNMIALVADLAYRAIRLNSQFKQRAPEQSPGIVLIDEVDMHLHPQWQQQVLGQLCTAFPQLQFIVTSHSPQVLSGISKKHIRLLGTNNIGEPIAAQPLAESYTRSNADVLQTIMHVNPVPQTAHSRKIAQYSQLVEQGNLKSPELAMLRQQLSSELGDDHPDLIRLEMVKRRRELLE